MFMETIHTEGLSHLSYIIGDGGQAAVIDPRRDCKLYVAIANRYGARITHIFETHRHEDFVVGSLELARRTKAQIFHGKGLSFQYGESAKDGDFFDFGHFRLTVIQTPGHTPESICLAVTDRNFDHKPIAVFTGDTLFIGDTGRVDLHPSMSEELAKRLYESIHEKLLPLGDRTIIYPAHGHGSVCGGRIASRGFSTIGYEREYNPDLRMSKKEFVKSKQEEEHYYAPYFRQMEILNQNGIQLVPKLPEPSPLDPETFAGVIKKREVFILDTRSPEAYAGAHIPGSLNIPLDILPVYAGWFLPYTNKIVFITERDSDVSQARVYLMRLGYDNLHWYLAGGMRAWVSAGKKVESIPVVDTQTLQNRIDNKEKFLILDVRTNKEFAALPSYQSRRIWIGELPQQTGNLPRNKKIVALCNSGQRASIAASLLRLYDQSFNDIEICLGCTTLHAATQYMHSSKAKAA